MFEKYASPGKNVRLGRGTHGKMNHWHIVGVCEPVSLSVVRAIAPVVIIGFASKATR